MKLCSLCKKPIVLNPTAAERARNCRNGHSAKYYENLFTTHSECQIKQWYGR
ncbi:hypothetical protein K5F27_16810 [Acinetobacter baumannii]|uniref:hypothetical protein n=1 Tax=Acinetobacter baumannii TaxID=470 RepID=UPI001FF33C78|nr:hypothetical protein [Acinetobacter baumannii]MCJ9118995.1 hypothetical protein [Acinetobacter baumannii]MCJ9181357.1 hypothetical protein [Acinetobacter baumannii]MCJ9185079.1 hypothetical protein [Acinetobacter baumannii]MCJ9192391.1 hypothetical protein [Acinetobacter baumannii]MCJ9199670.1 hypothetical protein [Acinetobacter baumannii]